MALITIREPAVKQGSTFKSRNMFQRKQNSEQHKAVKLRDRMQKVLAIGAVFGYEVGWCCRPNASYKQKTVEDFIRANGAYVGTYMNFDIYTVKNIYENTGIPEGHEVYKQLTRMCDCDQLPKSAILIRKGA